MDIKGGKAGIGDFLRNPTFLEMPASGFSKTPYQTAMKTWNAEMAGQQRFDDRQKKQTLDYLYVQQEELKSFYENEL